MFRKAISVFLLLIILSGSAAPFVSANTSQADRAAQCAADSQFFSTDLLTFMVGNLLWGAAFMGIDMLTSFLETLTIFGWKVGGAIEPLEQAIGFVRHIWMEALIWGLIASFFNWFAGSLIEAGIALNLTLSAGNPLIAYGGRIILQIVNLGLVISIIFIGIATILRLQQNKYSADKLLIKLIVGIIFVNLTIPAAISIAGIGTIVTDVMYRSSAPCPTNITRQFTAWELKARFATLLRGGEQAPVTIEEPPYVSQEFDGLLLAEDPDLSPAERRRLDRQRGRIAGQASAFTGILGGLTVSFLSLMAGSAMSFVAALTFLAFAIFLLIRFVVLMLLITFSPLIWFGFIFSDFKIPGFGNIWSGWWSQFLKWTFFGPIIVLFLAFVSEYLYSITADPIALAGAPGFTQNFIQIAQLLVVLLISAIGLYATHKFSGAAGGLVMQAASGGLGFVASRASGVAKKGVVGTQMRIDKLESEGKHDEAKKLKSRLRWLQSAEAGAGLKKSSSSLARVGIKPTIKTLDEKEVRKKLASKKIAELKKTPKGALHSFNEEDIKALSKDDKEAFITAIREVQKISSSLTPKELSALRKHEKTFAPELAKETMKDVEAPTTLTFGKAMTSDDLSKAKNMLQLSQESMRDIINNGTIETIEKGAKTILALESELMANPASFNRAELGKLQALRRNFDEKITDYILDNLDDPSTASPESLKSILNLSNKNLSYISKSGTASDKDKIDKALAHLVTHATTSTEVDEWSRVDTKIGILKSKHEWL